METIELRKVVVARTAPGEMLLALFDGAAGGQPNKCVGLFTCSDRVAKALVNLLNGALKGSKT